MQRAAAAAPPAEPVVRPFPHIHVSLSVCSVPLSFSAIVFVIRSHFSSCLLKTPCSFHYMSVAPTDWQKRSEGPEKTGGEEKYHQSHFISVTTTGQQKISPLSSHHHHSLHFLTQGFAVRQKFDITAEGERRKK